MSNPTNMIDFVKELASRSRGRACVVLTHDYQGQNEWAAKLAHQTGSEHLNLLELFAQDDSLTDRIGYFLVTELFKFLEDRSKASVLIISGMEFLKATWTGQSSAIDDFARRVQTWDKKPCLLFVLQYDKTIATYNFGRRHQYRYVIDQEDTLAL